MRNPRHTREKTSFPLHRFSAHSIRNQVLYGQSEPGKRTSQNIVKAKIRNCHHILTNYRQSRSRAGSDITGVLLQIQEELVKSKIQLAGVEERQQLFLLEAKAARSYWNAVATLCHQAPSWTRIHPGGEDALNRLLNVGYTNLARQCRSALLSAQLLPQFGVLHGDNSIEPLVFDFIEIFRQPAVDAVIIPFFSRKQRETNRLPRPQAREVFERIYQKYDERVEYNGTCQPLKTILYREAVSLRKAIESGREWHPFLYPWRHGKRCD